ncbi:MAG: NfeD family protein [Candidatus Bathyarchaeota archaeon]|nr:NfeD family protein [Candidatus Bathyarchaeota archaeon]
MKIALTVKADELKIAQLLSKFAEKYHISYKLNRHGTGFLLQVDLDSDDLGEFIRRMNHLKDAEYKIEEIRGGGPLDQLNVALTRTNADILIGKEAVAKNDLTPLDGGIIKIGGEVWLARPADGAEIKQGSMVRVVRIEGVTLVVEGVTKE